MATNADAPLDLLWKEYSLVFRDFDDLTLLSDRQVQVETDPRTYVNRDVLLGSLKSLSGRRHLIRARQQAGDEIGSRPGGRCGADSLGHRVGDGDGCLRQDGACGIEDSPRKLPRFSLRRQQGTAEAHEQSQRK